MILKHMLMKKTVTVSHIVLDFVQYQKHLNLWFTEFQHQMKLGRRKKNFRLEM